MGLFSIRRLKTLFSVIFKSPAKDISKSPTNNCLLTCFNDAVINPGTLFTSFHLLPVYKTVIILPDTGVKHDNQSEDKEEDREEDEEDDDTDGIVESLLQDADPDDPITDNDLYTCCVKMDELSSLWRLIHNPHPFPETDGISHATQIFHVVTLHPPLIC